MHFCNNRSLIVTTTNTHCIDILLEGEAKPALFIGISIMCAVPHRSQRGWGPLCAYCRHFGYGAPVLYAKWQQCGGYWKVLCVIAPGTERMVGAGSLVQYCKVSCRIIGCPTARSSELLQSSYDAWKRLPDITGRKALAPHSALRQCHNSEGVCCHNVKKELCCTAGQVSEGFLFFYLHKSALLGQSGI